MPCRQRANNPRGEPSPPLGQPEAADSSPGDPSLAPRFARRSADGAPLEATSDPRLCPESRRVPRSPRDKTAAACTACTLHCDRQHRARPPTTKRQPLLGMLRPRIVTTRWAGSLFAPRRWTGLDRPSTAAHAAPEIAAFFQPAPNHRSSGTDGPISSEWYGWISHRQVGQRSLHMQSHSSVQVVPHAGQS